jgi:hypothetical protein
MEQWREFGLPSIPWHWQWVGGGVVPGFHCFVEEEVTVHFVDGRLSIFPALAMATAAAKGLVAAPATDGTSGTYTKLKGTGLGAQRTLKALPKVLLEGLCISTLHRPPITKQFALATTTTSASTSAIRAHLK